VRRIEVKHRFSCAVHYEHGGRASLQEKSIATSRSIRNVDTRNLLCLLHTFGLLLNIQRQTKQDYDIQQSVVENSSTTTED